MSRTPSYPRGTPFKAPPASPVDLDVAPPAPTTRPLQRVAALSAREAWLFRWGYVLAGCALAVVTLTLLGAALMVQRALDRVDRLTAARLEPVPTRVEVVAPVSAPPLTVRPEPALRADLLPAVTAPAPVLPAPAPPAPALPREPANRERALEVVGGLSAGHLYQSYLNIGMLADAVENEIYGDTEARKLLATITSLMDTVDQQLARLGESLTDPDDQKKLIQVRQLSALLRLQAKELRGCWDVPAKDAAQRKLQEVKFHQAREEAWKGVRELLGIEEE